MANLSNGKRSIRNDFGHIAGDFNADHLKLEMMTERETYVSPTSKSLSQIFGTKEFVLFGIIATCVYLMNGDHSQFLCTLLTSIPPAIFSYRVLTNPRTTKEGYHSILFYWTLYGVFTLIDQIAADAQGYNLCKSGLLGTVFAHAIRLNPQAWKKMKDMTQDLVHSVITQYDSHGFLKKTNSSHFVVHTPTMTQFSDDSEYMMNTTAMIEQGILEKAETTTSDEDGDSQVEEFDYFDDDIPAHTAHSFLPSLAMQTTQKLSPEYVAAHNDDEDGESDLKTATMNIRSEQKKFISMSAMTVSTVAGVKDIITIPSDKICFSRNNQEVTVRVTNISHLHLMFGLKTNADTHLVAAPTTGFLTSGQSITIRIGVTNKFFDIKSDPGKSIDKLAIDYTLIPQSMSKMYSEFSNSFFYNTMRKRHAIKVFYQ